MPSFSTNPWPISEPDEPCGELIPDSNDDSEDELYAAIKGDSDTLKNTNGKCIHAYKQQKYGFTFRFRLDLPEYECVLNILLYCNATKDAQLRKQPKNNF